MMKPAHRGAKPLAAFTSGLISEALAARGLGEASLIADWPAIVGELSPVMLARLNFSGRPGPPNAILRLRRGPRPWS